MSKFTSFLSLDLAYLIIGAILMTGVGIYLYPVALHYWRKRQRAQRARRSRSGRQAGSGRPSR